MKLAYSWLVVAVVTLLVGCGGSAPTINSFTANKSNVPYGQPVQLSWSVEGAESLTLNGKPVTGSVAAVTPTATTTYTLVATNSHGSATSSPITVTLTAGLMVQGGTYNNGTLGTTFAVRLRDDHGATQTGEVDVTITPPTGASFTLACGASQALCFFVRAAAPESGNYEATADFGSGQVESQFSISSASTLGTAQVSATVDGSNVNVSWSAISGAQYYLAQVLNLDTGDAVSQMYEGTQPQATLALTQTLSQDGNYGVEVDAVALNPFDPNPPDELPTPNASRALGYLKNLPGSHWELYGPADYTGSQLTVTVPNLDPAEHLAIIAMNFGDVDYDPSSPVSNATITVSGVSPSASVAPLAPSLAMGVSAARPQPSITPTMRERALEGHDRIRAREAKVLADQLRMEKAGVKFGPRAKGQAQLRTKASGAAATTTTFCVQQGISAGAPYVRKNATLKKETAHALFYLDDDDAGDYAPYETGGTDDVWNQLGSFWDNTAYPIDTQTFGAESDEDGNGKLIVFVSKELGAPNAQGAITLGYYWAGDVVYAKDTSGSCSVSGSNGADMFYLNSFQNLAQAGYSASDTIAVEYPATLAHEFQHLINYNQKHLLRTSDPEDTWINEGLSKTAEDLVGFGWNDPLEQSFGNAYLEDSASSSTGFLTYSNASLENWVGDPIGNYEGAHAFFRYVADQRGADILKNIVQTTGVGRGNVASVLGEPFEQAFAEWTTALMFSNETFAPGTRFNYTGAGWTPLHLKLVSGTGRLGYVEYRSFSGGSASASLRALGWNAFVTHSGLGQPVTITVSPTVSGVQPEIAVVRFSGTLPDGR